MKSRMLKLLGWAAVPALMVAGFAVASPGQDQSGDGDEQDRFEMPAPPPGVPGGPGVVAFAGPGPRGALGDGGELLYGEEHILRDGEEVVVHSERGTVDSI